MAVTTDDCRKFLVDFFKVHSHMVVELFEGDPDNPAEEYPGQIASMITKSKNWKRRYKCKPGSETGYCCIVTNVKYIRQLEELQSREPILFGSVDLTAMVLRGRYLTLCLNGQTVH